MNVKGHYHDLPWKTRIAVGDMAERIQAGWNIEHGENGAHRAIRPWAVIHNPISSLLTDDVDVWDPLRGTESSCVFVTPTGSGLSIGSLVNPYGTEALEVTLTNEHDTYAYTLLAGTGRENFAGIGGTDITVGPGDMVRLLFSPAKLVWRAVKGTAA